MLHRGLFRTPEILRTVKRLIDIRGASLDMEDQITRWSAEWLIMKSNGWQFRLSCDCQFMMLAVIGFFSA